jgi:hypothetical protein
VVGNFSQLHEFVLNEAPLQQLYHFGEFSLQIHYLGGSGFGGAKPFG